MSQRETEQTWRPQLTPELLDRLESVWRAQGAPLTRHLQPGLSGAEIDALTAQVALRVPPEGRLWWGTHNGAVGDDDQMLGTGWRHTSLAEAVQATVMERDRYWVDYGFGEPYWPRSWLVFSIDRDGRGVLALDCADPLAALTPVYQQEGTEARPDKPPGAPSLGTAVEWWIEALESGAAAYDSASGAWTYDYTRLDRERELTRIV